MGMIGNAKAPLALQDLVPIPLVINGVRNLTKYGLSRNALLSSRKNYFETR
jgi:hypothetical protein